MTKVITLGVMTVIFALTIFVRTGQADIMYQTVPTMPPPTATRTKTPQQTSTYSPQPTETIMLPTPTPEHATNGPPTATVEVGATETIQPVSITPTSTPAQINQSAAPITSTSTPTKARTAINTTTVVISPPPSQEQIPVKRGFNLGLYVAVGGGILVFGYVLVRILRMRK